MGVLCLAHAVVTVRTLVSHIVSPYIKSRIMSISPVSRISPLPLPTLVSNQLPPSCGGRHRPTRGHRAPVTHDPELRRIVHPHLYQYRDGSTFASRPGKAPPVPLRLNSAKMRKTGEKEGPGILLRPKIHWLGSWGLVHVPCTSWHMGIEGGQNRPGEIFRGAGLCFGGRHLLFDSQERRTKAQCDL